MPKILTIIGMVVAVLLVLLFGLDLGLSFPFKRASFLLDLCLVIVGLALFAMSWFTYKEQE